MHAHAARSGDAVVCEVVSDVQPLPPPSGAFPPPVSAGQPSPYETTAPRATSILDSGRGSAGNAAEEPAATRLPRAGELVTAWRVVLVLAWAGAFLAYMAVWKASEEMGIATWWLGPRSNPQPVVIRLIPFVVTATFGAISSFGFRHVSLLSMGGAVMLGVIAVPDFSRSVGLALVEVAIAVAVGLVAAVSLTGRYRAPKSRAPTRPRAARPDDARPDDPRPEPAR